MEGIWTGELNGHALVGSQPPGRVRFYDTTLRDGEQTVGVVFTPDQKLAIATALDKLGVERIEAGFPRVSEDDRRAVELIRDAGLHAEIWGFSRAVRADVDVIVELGLAASVIESPLSDLKLSALGVPREHMLERIADAVSYAAGNGIRVAFFGVDGSRADLGFLEHAYRVAVEAGAKEVVVVDTLGIAAPETAAFLVAGVRDWLGPDIPIHFHGHNDFGLATAAAIAAVRAGAEWIHGTINGMGERAGNASIGEVAMALTALYGAETGLDLGRIRKTSALLRSLGGYQLEPWKAIVGDNLFVRESGAVASQFHDPPSIEPFSSALVGAERRIVLGKKSGLDSVRIRAEELGLDVPETRRAALLDAVKKLGTEKRGLVTDDEFSALARSLSAAESEHEDRRI
jgi:isopropylmalate/homocitrate/citramalate synthase